MAETENTMTKERALELWSSNRPEKLLFTSYYKYSFTFAGETHLLKFSGSLGGDSNDIYRMSIGPEMETPANPKEEFRSFTITNKLTGETFEYWEPW